MESIHIVQCIDEIIVTIFRFSSGYHKKIALINIII